MRGRALAPGTATGPATVLDEPLSLWGGFDPGTGALIEARHPQHGAVLAGRVLVMPAARGSSSSSSVLAEAVRAGVAPAAILLGEPDHILAIGAAVAEELYSVQVPILILNPADLASIREGAIVNVEGERVTIG
jgi:predicted aconitase with swiveling domain